MPCTREVAVPADNLLAACPGALRIAVSAQRVVVGGASGTIAGTIGVPLCRCVGRFTVGGERTAKGCDVNLSGLIPLLGGVYCLLVAFRVVRVSKNLDANERWLQKYGTWLKILAPIVILFGLAELVGALR